ncbi:MAG TPA: hypothetical protein PKA60_01230 [Candidatus Paceibacterota bacterium]|nr:hypothetical protein [Candidatus Paceibacterota bacterium]
MYKWDIYEVTAKETPIHGVMFRGRIRKYAILNNINLLTENASDKENVVRFAVEKDFDPKKIIIYIKQIIFDSEITLIQKELVNPVLSKIKINLEERY